MKTKQVDFDKANDYLELCNNAEWALSNKDKVTPNGYIVKDVMVKTKMYQSNFKAVLFQKDDKYVMAFLGTDFSSPKDIAANISMVIGRRPRQFNDAEEFVKRMINKHKLTEEKITPIGNSEGGTEALHVKAKFGFEESYLYNPYVAKLDEYEDENLKNVYSFRASGDIVSKGGVSIGEDYIVPLKDNVNARKGPMGIADYHRIINLGDCKQAIPVNEYKKIDPSFKNKYREGKLKSYEIREIPQEMYALFDDDINDRLKNNAVVNENRPVSGAPHNSKCAGTYHVSGYTRSDGVKVSAYSRTCGAAHHS